MQSTTLMIVLLSGHNFQSFRMSSRLGFCLPLFNDFTDIGVCIQPTFMDFINTDYFTQLFPVVWVDIIDQIILTKAMTGGI